MPTFEIVNSEFLVSLWHEFLDLIKELWVGEDWLQSRASPVIPLNRSTLGPLQDRMGWRSDSWMAGWGPSPPGVGVGVAGVSRAGVGDSGMLGLAHGWLPGESDHRLLL